MIRFWHAVQSQWFPRRPTLHSRQPTASVGRFHLNIRRFYVALLFCFVFLVWLQFHGEDGGLTYPIDVQSIESVDDATSVSSGTEHQSGSSSSPAGGDPVQATPTNNDNHHNDGKPSHNTPLKLRHDWSNLTPSLELTRRYVVHQSNCSLPLGDFVYRNLYGMGSDLHFWGRALCNGLALGKRIRTIGNWTWLDRERCSSSSSAKSPMLCYFPKSELQCPQDEDYVRQHASFDPQHGLSKANGGIQNKCQSVTQGLSTSDQRTAGLEFLFLHMSPLVIQEAERQLNLVFRGRPNVPKDLITVHIRWGDKKAEMRLVPIHSYISAVKRILEKRGASSSAEANIFLATEDPAAVKAFQQAMPSSWNLYLDQFYVDMLPFRVSGYNGNPEMGRRLDGKAGLVTLGSILVAMEANDFVLTTASNWSRMMNELRQSIVDPRCGNCTNMIDLRKPMRNNE